MMHRQYSDEQFAKEAPVFIRNFTAHKVYKASSLSILIVVRGYLEIASEQDRITELSAIADSLISRANTHSQNLQSLILILTDLMSESEHSSDAKVLALRGEIRRLLSQPI